MKPSLVVLKVIATIFLAVIVFVLFSAVHLSMIRTSDLRAQEKRIKRVEKSYDSYEAKGYLPYSDESLDDIPYNQTKFIASHNSYRKRGSLIGKLFVGLGDSFDEAKALNYSYDTITNQLQNGIFSFELDVRLRKNNFEITHVPLVDNSSTAVNFEKALLEYKYFLEHEENSFPILVILEIKDDYMFLDPFLKQIGSEELLKLENKIEETLGDYLYKPSDMVLNYDSLKARVDDIGWPKISELKGKIMFVLHAGSFANTYSDLKDNKDQSLFTATYKNQLNDKSVFIIHNSLDVETINELVLNNYMVRTRVGDTLSYTKEDEEKALLSNAQIITSDFTIARSDINEYFYFNENKTIIKNNNN